jgi:hypothetical protein
LLPELADSIREDAFGPFIDHPLVSTHYVPGSEVRLNRLVEARRRRIAAALADDDGFELIALHETPYRLDALLGYGLRLSDESYWEAVRFAWTDTETPGLNLELWEQVLDAPRLGRDALMTSDERATLAALPDEVTVYRGFNHDGGQFGLSWTLDAHRAEWFAHRFAFNGVPRVAVGQVDRDLVIAYFACRREAEIVALAEDVDVTMVVQLT